MFLLWKLNTKENIFNVFDMFYSSGRVVNPSLFLFFTYIA